MSIISAIGKLLGSYLIFRGCQKFFGFLSYKFKLDQLNQTQYISVDQLRHCLKPGQQKCFFVKGEISKEGKILESSDKQFRGVLIQKTKLDREKNQVNKERPETVESFLLQTPQSTGISLDLEVQKFSNTQILPGVLSTSKAITQEYNQKMVISSPESISYAIQPQSTFSLTIQEDVLVQGSVICLFGNIIWENNLTNKFLVSAPEFFGKSKEQIIKYVEKQKSLFGWLTIGFIVGGLIVIGITKEKDD